MSGDLIFALETLQSKFKNIRPLIEGMTDEQLIAAYEQLSAFGNIAWYLRCLVIGIAKDRSKHGDGTVKSIAQAFGISVRMAQIDITVYGTFIKTNPEFNPTLPARFYQLAVKTKDPRQAIEYADEMYHSRRYSSAEFERAMAGKMPRTPAEPGLYRLEPSENVVHESEPVELFGHVSLFRQDDILYAKIQ